MKTVVMALAALTLPTQAALALEAHASKEVSAAPSAVWAVIGDFCGIVRWHPAIAACESSQKDEALFRTLTLKGGGQILEKQTARDDGHHTYSYSIVNGPLPVSAYRSTLKVTPKGNGSKIEWMGSFDAKEAPAEEVIELITGIYQAGVDGVAAHLTK